MTDRDQWFRANQGYLVAALAVVRQRLIQHTTTDALADQQLAALEADLAAHGAVLPAPAALQQLCAAFNLSAFERELLLLCAGFELDARFAALCATANGDAQRAFPTFGLALATLDAAHWSALTPTAPLRFWRLIDVQPGLALTTSPLRLDERILHFLAGVQYLDTRLAGLIEPLPASGALVDSHAALVERLSKLWQQPDGSWPVLQLCGAATSSKTMLANAVAARCGLGVQRISAQMLPTNLSELDQLGQLWEREAILTASALLIDCEELDASDPRLTAALNHWLNQVPGPIFVTTHEPRAIRERATYAQEVPKPTTTEQLQLWHEALGPTAASLNGTLETLVGQFNLPATTITALGGALRTEAAQAKPDELASLLWQTCRMQTRSRLDDLAQRIEAAAGWDDLVLPAAQQQILHEIGAHVRQRAKVYHSWGFAQKGARGLGISALFAGESGTGKTMAAEVLAQTLELDLYRIDLSHVVSKYIGETEKNLRRVFDAAEAGGAILLFDEADALFGKRSEVKDSHDRYANIEVSYLLQRMEQYQGLAILTTNLKQSLDQAFLRRIRFVVQFPFPDNEQRAAIWRRIFPASTPTTELRFDRLARLNVTGGNIRNIALNAAFLAAEANEAVGMQHLLRAAHSEYSKLEKPLTNAEIGGWL